MVKNEPQSNLPSMAWGISFVYVFVQQIVRQDLEMDRQID